VTALAEIEQFLYREARLADEGAYDAWEALWTDDGVYWVPAEGDDPDRCVSIIYDNRSRIALRVRQLKTGKRHAQTPPSSVRRLISNVEVLGEAGDDVLVGANFLAIESRPRGTVTWAGRSEYRLRREAGALRLVRKTVILVDRDRALPTMGFLI
jgi:3-phenylpropionate/cinnamic acid dioxygenase small subunit